jgi:hypothetical protein
MTLTTATEDILKVLEGVELTGHLNTPDAEIIANVRHSMRLGYPQIRQQAAQKDRVCLVGGGPSLEDTFGELRDLYFAGAKVVTVNGSYQWCLQRNIRPSAQIVLDARQDNARFIDPLVPQCRYLIASQCHPETWARVHEREDVWIWHSVSGENDVLKPILDHYYRQQWVPIPGGTTVIMRALTLLRTIGFVRFDLFGVDSCYLDGQHHAYAQPENDRDKPRAFSVHPTGHPELARVFQCAPWHVQQLACFLQTVRINGQHFVLNVHGDGLLAYALRASADIELSEAAATLGERSGKG